MDGCTTLVSVQPSFISNQKHFISKYMEQIYKFASRTLALIALSLVCISASAQDVVKTMADKGASGKFFAKLCPKTNVAIDKDDADVFSVYTDGANARFAQGAFRSNKYIIKAGECVIIKTAEEKEVKIESTSSTKTSFVWNDLICPATDMTLEAFKAEKGVTEGKYIYMLTNLERNGGFGFTHFGGTTLKAGNFYIITTKAPASSGRLDVEWVDADGNLLDEMTAIDAAVQAESEGEIYNLQGVIVAAPQTPGIYVRNGKKFMVK